MAILNTKFTSELTSQTNISPVNQKVFDYIQQRSSKTFDEQMEGEDNWQVFAQLSELRTGLISWYPFSATSHVLEIGAGFGALTGSLCDRCERVVATERSKFRAGGLYKRYEEKDNLEIIVGDFGDIVFKEQFDYILLVGILELVGAGQAAKTPYIEYLKQMKKLLKPKGKILLAVNNRLGLKSICGEIDSYTHEPFSGLNQYPKGTRGYSFSKAELDEILLQAGLTEKKYYYPLPDYKIPQLIFTDEYLPSENLKERLIPYYVDQNSVVVNETGLYKDIIVNGVFPVFANSFFVECTENKNLCDIKYAAISTDRGKECSFATVIYENRVVKQPLYNEGICNAKLLVEHLQDLKAHKIPVIDQTLKADGSIEMPVIYALTLSDYLKCEMNENIEHFDAILDRLYQYILSSSEYALQEENQLLKQIPQGNSSDLSWGPILKRAYIELIPLNCFFDNDTFLFFDQEFVRENYPANFIMFRAIHYIYCFTPNAEQIRPKQYLLDKYGITDTYDIFFEEEMCFLDKVRNHKIYSQFYKWANVNNQVIQANINRLRLGDN